MAVTIISAVVPPPRAPATASRRKPSQSATIRGPAVAPSQLDTQAVRCVPLAVGDTQAVPTVEDIGLLKTMLPTEAANDFDIDVEESGMLSPEVVARIHARRSTRVPTFERLSVTQRTPWAWLYATGAAAAIVLACVVALG